MTALPGVSLNLDSRILGMNARAEDTTKLSMDVPNVTVTKGQQENTCLVALRISDSLV